MAVGNILGVQLEREPRERLRLVTKDGVLLGSVVPLALSTILGCIRNEGRLYEAEIVSIKGGAVRVVIRLAR